MRMLFKNSTLVAALVALVVGALIGWLVGNLALGILFAVGVAIGALALMEELAVTPNDVAAGRVNWRDLRGRWRGAPGEAPSAPVLKPVGPEPRAPAFPAEAPPVPSGRTSEQPAASSAAERPNPERPNPERPSGERPDPGAARQRKIVLIAGVGQQLAKKSPARDLYSNPLFALNVQYAESLGADAIYVLSAKHHLLTLDDEVEPYDLFLSTMKADDLKSWSDEVLRQLAERADLAEDRFVVLAANKYRKHLLAGLTHVDLPTEGLSLSEQRDFLKAEADELPGRAP